MMTIKIAIPTQIYPSREIGSSEVVGVADTLGVLTGVVTVAVVGIVLAGVVAGMVAGIVLCGVVVGVGDGVRDGVGVGVVGITHLLFTHVFVLSQTPQTKGMPLIVVFPHSYAFALQSFGISAHPPNKQNCCAPHSSLTTVPVDVQCVALS